MQQPNQSSWEFLNVLQVLSHSPTTKPSNCSNLQPPHHPTLPTASPPGILATFLPVTEHSQLVASGNENSSLPISQHLVAASPPIGTTSSPSNSQRPHATSSPGTLTSITPTTERRPPVASPPDIAISATIKNKSRYLRSIVKPNRYTNN